jgi:hypothetical protein
MHAIPLPELTLFAAIFGTLLCVKALARHESERTFYLLALVTSFNWAYFAYLTH